MASLKDEFFLEPQFGMRYISLLTMIFLSAFDLFTSDLILTSTSGGENEDDVSNSVYFLNHDENRWDLKSEEMISGVTETTIHSSFATINLDMDLE